MSLRGEIALYQDYVLVTPQVWLKLLDHYGGAPEIMLQIIDKPGVKLEAPEMPVIEIDEDGSE